MKIDKLVDVLDPIYNKLKAIIFGNRMKSLYWRSGTLLVTGFLDLVLQDLTSWNPNNMITISAGLIIAEITKYLNKKSA